MDHNETIEGELQPTSPSWTIDVSDSDVRFTSPHKNQTCFSYNYNLSFVTVEIRHSYVIQYQQVRTIKVSNVSLHVSERNIFDFFTLSGSIVYIEMQRSVFLELVTLSNKRDVCG